MHAPILFTALAALSTAATAAPLHRTRSQWWPYPPTDNSNNNGDCAALPVYAREPTPEEMHRLAARQASCGEGYRRANATASASASTSNGGSGIGLGLGLGGISVGVSLGLGGGDATPTATTTAWTSTSTSSAPTPSNTVVREWYTLVDEASGTSFFDSWDFWNYDDPTHGIVDYQSASGAWDNGLVGFSEAGNALMKVETTQTVSGNRKSIRLHGKTTFNGGLVMLDVVHMPVGCGTWPAFWANGPNWPYGGEIDILEGVNEYTENQVSIHTGSGCTIPQSSTSSFSGQLTLSDPSAYNCASYETANQGCGIRDTNNQAAYGRGLNAAGGGVYAMLWNEDGIKVWFFGRNNIPSDIQQSNPAPSTWGTPVAAYASTSCNPFEYFKDNFAIFDTTLCGDWAGNVWNTGGVAGQSQSCAAMTGYDTCESYVRANGDKFQEAYWEVNYVKIYS